MIMGRSLNLRMNKHYKIISVDDERTAAMRFKYGLKAAKIDCSHFFHFINSDDLMDWLIENDYTSSCIFFIDLNLINSRLDGFQLIRELRKTFKDAKLFVVSKSPKVEDVDRAREIGATAYINKGSNLKVFSQRIANLKKDYLDGETTEFKFFGEPLK